MIDAAVHWIARATASALIGIAATSGWAIINGDDDGGKARTAAAPAPTAAAKAAARPPFCYHPSNRVPVVADQELPDDDYGVVYESVALWVPSSPCRDVNAREVRNAAGQQAGATVCVPLQVRIGDEVGRWVDTCQGWQVLWFRAGEGKPFVVRSALRPVTLVIAS